MSEPAHFSLLSTRTPCFEQVPIARPVLPKLIGGFSELPPLHLADRGCLGVRFSLLPRRTPYRCFREEVAALLSG